MYSFLEFFYFLFLSLNLLNLSEGADLFLWFFSSFKEFILDKVIFLRIHLFKRYDLLSIYYYFVLWKIVKNEASSLTTDFASEYIYFNLDYY